MLVVEGTLDRRPIARHKVGERQIHSDDVFLTDIAHIHRAMDQDLLRRHRSGRNGLATLLLEICENGIERLEGGRLQIGEPGSDEIVAQVGKQHAERGEMTGRSRNNDAADADLARDRRGMERAGPAIGDQHEIARIEPARGGDRLHRI